MHSSRAFCVKKEKFEEKDAGGIRNICKKDFETVFSPDFPSHFLSRRRRVAGQASVGGVCEGVVDASAPDGPIWSEGEVESVEITHETPSNMMDRVYDAGSFADLGFWELSKLSSLTR